MATTAKSRRINRAQPTSKAKPGDVANVDPIQRTVFGVEGSAVEVLHVGKTVEEAEAFAAGFNLAKGWANLEWSSAGVGVDMLLKAATAPGMEGVDLGDLSSGSNRDQPNGAGVVF